MIQSSIKTLSAPCQSLIRRISGIGVRSSCLSGPIRSTIITSDRVDHRCIGSSSSPPPTTTVTVATANPDLVDASCAPADFDPQSAVVYPDFITQTEHDALWTDLQSKFQRYVHTRCNCNIFTKNTVIPYNIALIFIPNFADDAMNADTGML